MGSFASDIAQIVPRVQALETGTPLFTTETVTITAGPGGDHSTLNAALAAASRLQAVQYAKGGLAVTITLKTGYTATVADQVIVDGVDLGFVTILSEDDEVPAAIGTRAVLTAGIIGSDVTAPLIGGRNKAVIPTIGCLFVFPDDGDGYCATASDGVALHSDSRGQVLPGCGVLRARRGCQALYGSEITCTIPGLTIGGAGSGADATGTGSISGTTLTVSATTRAGFAAGMRVGLIGIAANTEIEEQLTGATGGNGTYRVNISQTVASNPVTAGIYGASFRYASHRALHVAHGSHAKLPRARLDHGRGDYGAYIIFDSSANLYQAQIHDSTGYAITCRDGSTCNARETQVARSARGYHALHNAYINARSKDAEDLPGNPWVGDSAKDCTGYGVLASYNSNIDAAEVDVSGCLNRGVHASNGSTINFTLGVANDCAGYGVFAFDASTISALGAVANDCGTGFAAGNNSRVSADTSSAQRSSVAGYTADEGSTIHARNSNADGVSGTLPPIGFFAYRGSTINCRGSTARYCDTGFLAYEGSTINAQSANASNEGTWGFKVERGSAMTIGDATSGTPLGTYNVAQVNVSGPDGVIYDHSSSNRAVGVGEILNISNPAIPVAQTPLYDPFFGFNNGITDTTIFPGAGRAPQGLASVRHLGVDYDFIAVPAETSGPAVRIVQFERGNPTAVAMAPALTVNHHTLGAYSDGTDIFIVFASGPYDDPLAEEGAEFPNYNRGKSLAIMPWSGADTVADDITLYRLFDDWGTSQYGSRYFNSSITCSNDGEYIIVSGNDYAAYDRTNAARHVFVFRRAEIVAAGADARGVMPIHRFDMEHPSGYDCNCYQDLTCARDPVTGLYNLAAFVGRIPVFAPQALLIFNLFGDGKPVRTIYYDGIRAKYQRAGLLDYAAAFPDEDDLGIPRSTEGEGISYDADGNLLTLTIDDWIAPGAIVTYGGQNWALRTTSSGYSAAASPSPDYWVLTTKAANAGAYTVDAVYSAPGNSTRRAKVIYKVALATGAEGEQPCDGGIQVPRNTARISFGQDWRDIDFPRGSGLLVGCVDQFTNEWKRRFRLSDGGGHEFYDGNPAANNNTYGHIAYIDRPTEKELRINSRSYGRAFGSSLYLYPPDDPRATAGMAELYTGEGHLSIATTAAGKTTLSGTSVVPAVANRSDSGMAATWQRAGVDRAGIYLTTVNFVLSSMAGTVFGIGRRDDGSTTATPTIDWQLDPTTGAWKPASAGRDLGLSSNKILDAHITTLRLYPPASVTPAANGELTLEAGSDTKLTHRYKGSDGVVRSADMIMIPATLAKRSLHKVLGRATGLTTGATVKTALWTLPIAAGEVQAGDILRISVMASVPTGSVNTNAKYVIIELGGQTFFAPAGTTFTATVRTICPAPLDVHFPTLSTQVGRPATTTSGTSTVAPFVGTVDMAVAQDLVVSGYVGTGGDILNVDSVLVELIRMGT